MKQELTNYTFKVLIFDLNGTITGSVSDHPAHIAFRNNYIEQQLGKSLTVKLPNATSLALQICGLNPLRYYIYRNSKINWNQFHKYEESTLEGFLWLKNQGYKLVLYTDCLSEQIKSTMRLLKMENLFDLIISEEFNMKKPTPKVFNYITKKLNCSYSEILMVGNDYNKDLMPLKFLGGSIIQLDNTEELPKVFEIIANLT
tara:strand:+ start:644 stop:1246 length:603 start_codon:yes stop_codon:yes gene_type:complete